MTYTVSITSQGQISIPARVRKELGLDKKKKALVSIEAGKMVVEPVVDLLELGGSLSKYAKGKKVMSNQEIHEFVANEVVEEYKEKQKQE